MTRPALMTRHPFDEAMALVPLAASTEERGPEAPGHFQGAPHPAYANMVGPFGGITAARIEMDGPSTTRATAPAATRDAVSRADERPPPR